MKYIFSRFCDMFLSIAEFLSLKVFKTDWPTEMAIRVIEIFPSNWQDQNNPIN